MSLSKQQIAQVKDLKYDVVDMTPEWGDVVKVKSMSVRQQLALDKSVSKDNFAIQMIMMCCLNDDGTLMFDDPENDEKILEDKDPKAIIKLFNGIKKINGLYDGAVDDMAKNSSASPSD